MTLADLLKASAARVKNTTEAAQYVGGEQNLKELVEGFELKPIKSNGKVTHWDTNILDQALDMAQVEGWPYRKRQP